MSIYLGMAYTIPMKVHGLAVAIVTILLLALGTVVLWTKVLAEMESSTLTVAFLDVGQGDATYIETPSGVQVLIDGGNGSHVLRGLGQIMPWFDRSIDVVVATHPDNDHIGGLPRVFARYDIATYIESGVHDDDADQQTLLQAVSDEGITPIYAREGMSLMLEEDIYLTFLFPHTDVSAFEANTASIVSRLTFGETSFFFTGDSPRGIETFVAQRYGDALSSNVLKVGHHGSRTSTSDLFLGFLSPTHAVVSAGCDNTYGHPHREVLEALSRFDIQVLETCEHGTVIFQSDGEFVKRIR